MLVSFSQKYLADAQDDINVLLEQMKIVNPFIGIRVKCLWTVCFVWVQEMEIVVICQGDFKEAFKAI